MSPLSAPPIERRTRPEFAALTAELLERYAGWRPAGPGDPGAALVQVFAHMAEGVADRVNRAADKNFLAFLDLLGLELLPAQPARVPLAFALAGGATADALVPAGTPVAAPPAEGETEPVVFETERDLTVTATRLAHVVSRDPADDSYADRTADALAARGFPAFAGTSPAGHDLYLAFGDVLAVSGPSTVTLALGPGEAPWPRLASWSYLAGGAWHPVAATWDEATWQVRLGLLPAVPVEAVHKRTGRWLRARLTVPMARRGDEPAAAFTGTEPIDLAQAVHPFGIGLPHRPFLLAAQAFGVPLATVRIAVDVDPAVEAAPSSDLELLWECRVAGDDAWKRLGISTTLTGNLNPDAAPGFSDGTMAFTRSGVAAFTAPAEWASADWAGTMGAWLRVTVARGSYSTGGLPKPPALSSVKIGYAAVAPTLGSAAAAASASAAGLAPAAGFANATPLDLTKDFFPFGERPRFGDVVYLALPEVDDKPGAALSLGVELSNPANASAVPAPAKPSNDLTLRWEFWNGVAQRWDTLGDSTHAGTVAGGRAGFADATNALTASAAVTFTRPPEMGPTTVSGVAGMWVRARIVAGNYGVEARYQAATGTAGYTLVPATYAPPSIRSAALSYTYQATEPAPRLALAENGMAVTEAAAPAAGQPLAALIAFEAAGGDPALYLGFERTGADTGFANTANTLYVGVGEREHDPAAPAGDPAVIVWEYWNGSEWGELAVDDGTDGLSRRGLVTFVGPADFRLSTELGRAAFWLRARLASGDAGRLPRVERVLLNTTWASQTSVLAGEVLGSAGGDRGQAFRTARAPVLPGQVLEVMEPGIPSAAERRRILDEEDAEEMREVPGEPGAAGEVWVRWRQVPDFYGSGPRSRHYTLDRASGEVRFGDGRRGLVPPRGRANVRMSLYRTGGGPQGNRDAGTVTQLRTTIPYVASVTNPEPSAGGSAAETLAAVKLRGPRLLRHRGRAVTPADYEDLAMEASPEVAAAHAVPTGDDGGRVAVVVVPRSAAARPVPGADLLERVAAYLAERCPPTVDLEVAGPEWLELSVTADVAPVSADAARTAGAAVSAALAAYLHPLTGGADGLGWPPGQRPHRSELYALVERVGGVDHLRRLSVAESGAAASPRFLVYSGAHRVTVSAAAGG
ncbi:MAG TPA: putative baseplate assembly protein [Longimicrobiaceae bacterium]|nr:putative baseplate assembly protein [Longimicrobiaceae bacterium]